MTEPLRPLRDAFARSFPAGSTWATEALSRLGRTPDDETPVRSVVQGWMRLGGEHDALLVDTLFVLSEDELGFGQTHIHTSDPNWVPLSTVVALDLIEGVPYPLEAIEVQFAGGLAIFVGWPEDFSQAVLDALLGPAPESATVHLDTTAEEAVADGVAVDDIEPAEEAPFARTGAVAASVMPPLFAASEADEAPTDTATGDDEPAGGAAPTAPAPSLLSRLNAPTTPFAPDDGPGSFLDEDESSELEDRWFAELEPRDDAEDGASLFSVSPPTDDDVPEVPEDAPRERGPWDDPAMPWPEPFRNCVFLGGHPVHQRRRKNVVVVMRPGGLVVAASGSNGWSVHVPWHEVRRIDVQGADEVKFTHNHRIDINGSALVVEQVDGTALIVEVRNRRPATVRSGLAPVISMANATGPGGSNADVSAF